MTKPRRRLNSRGILDSSTGGIGYIPYTIGYNIGKGVKVIGKKVLNKVRQNLYDRVDPYSYDIGDAVSQLVYKGRETKKNDVYDALWAKYLNRNNNDVGYNIDDYIQPAIYKPNKGIPVGQTYRLTSKSWNDDDDLNPLGDKQLYEMLKSGKTSDLGDGVGGTKTGLGTYTKSLGEDEKGKYMSYYDEWDISPIGNKSGKEGKDQTFGIGTPFSVYDRRYYTDDEARHILSEYDKMYQSIKEASNNQSVKHEIYSPKPYRSKKRDGGSIYIKPSKRGTVSDYVNAIYANNPKEEFLGQPNHNYDFTQSEEWANAHGYYPDKRGHRDDRVKKPTHPSHPSRGTWEGNKFILTNKGLADPNYIFFGLNDGGQDPQAILKYKDTYVIPEVTVTPKGNYINNSYDNIRLHFKEGGIYIAPSKRGTFRAAALKHGMGVQEFASRVLANKEDYSSAMVKKANFARNASKWKH